MPGNRWTLRSCCDHHSGQISCYSCAKAKPGRRVQTVSGQFAHFTDHEDQREAFRRHPFAAAAELTFSTQSSPSYLRQLRSMELLTVSQSLVSIGGPGLQRELV